MRNTLENIEPHEPQGWFRWLHNHSAGRCGLRARFRPREAEIKWEEASPELVGIHAWEAGFDSRLDVLNQFWESLTSLQRGAAAAGASENKNCMEWVSSRLPSCELNAASTCELACNAVSCDRIDLLRTILDASTDRAGEVPRWDGPGQPTGRFSEITGQLSCRCIDLVLEAALISKNLNAIRLALNYGANADIPIWALERSFNERHCALSYGIKNQMADAVEMLLAAGARPGGIAFCTPNLPLFQAMSTAQHDVAIRLLESGASFADSDPGNQRKQTIAKARKKKIISPANDYFFGYSEEELSWVRDGIGSLIPLVSVGDKPCFYIGNGQGGTWSTFLDVAGNDIDVIRRYEERGLDARLSAEEFLAAVNDSAYSKLLYLLKDAPETVKGRILFRVRRRNPSFGSLGPLALLPQEDRISDAMGFDPGSQEPLILPDGSSLFVDLDSIAKPGHPHGPCLRGHFWLLTEKPALRRRGDRTVMKRNRVRWEMAVIPEKIYHLKDLLPVVRCIDGHYIRIGCSLGKIGFLAQDEQLSELISDWDDSPQFQKIAEEAGRRIRVQNESNSRPPELLLTEEELDGYPKKFWPFLDRLETGLIGIRPDIASPEMCRDYRIWERKNKREDSFVPDPRILDYGIWEEVPPELKPFLVWDDLFERPRFGNQRNTKYERAMSRKATNWWNNWITPQILKAIGEERQ